ncbi:MAG: hypothetical protein LC808_06965, partial [Actinobacteria bacterium]|nr:hypothetical protein [Actinomycetota bacterium]
AYLQAHLDTPEGVLGTAINMATTVHAETPNPMGYGWSRPGAGNLHTHAVLPSHDDGPHPVGGRPCHHVCQDPA